MKYDEISKTFMVRAEILFLRGKKRREVRGLNSA